MTKHNYYPVEVFNADLPADVPIWDCWVAAGFAKVIPKTPDPNARFSADERELVEGTIAYLQGQAKSLARAFPRGAMQLRLRAARLRVMLRDKGE